MWNSRFSALSGNPFDNSRGFIFPAPEGTSLSYLPHLLVAQAFIPPTERTEVAGFDFPGDNDAIRAEVMRRLNAVPGYRTLFGRVFPEVRNGGAITFEMFLNEDYGREDFTGAAADRYEFRTPSLRNIALEPAFMYDGAFTSLAAAIRFHLNVAATLRTYDPAQQGLPADLTGTIGPVEPLLERLDPLLAKPIVLTPQQLRDLVAFVREGLLDPRAEPQNLRSLVPGSVPSGRALLMFEFPPAQPKG